jgi:hypothetical protein
MASSARKPEHERRGDLGFPRQPSHRNQPPTDPCPLRYAIGNPRQFVQLIGLFIREPLGLLAVCIEGRISRHGDPAFLSTLRSLDRKKLSSTSFQSASRMVYLRLARSSAVSRNMVTIRLRSEISVWPR